MKVLKLAIVLSDDSALSKLQAKLTLIHYLANVDYTTWKLEDYVEPSEETL